MLSQMLNTKPAYDMTVDAIASSIVAVENSLTKIPLKFPLTVNGGAQISNTDASGNHLF